MPPNQAATVKSQQKINEKRKQTPEYRNTKDILYRKSCQLLRDKLPNGYGQNQFQIFTGSADSTPKIRNESVDLIVTSPPFLDIVNYRQHNWLRMWFANVEMKVEDCWQIRNLTDWLIKMKSAFEEFNRILKLTGIIVFEVGEVCKGNLLLDNEIVKIALDAGFYTKCIIINSQNFTKTANCWGVKNNKGGTNSNRTVVLRKDTAPNSFRYNSRPISAGQQIKLF